MTLRAAVVGCGFIGAGRSGLTLGVQSHAAAYRRHPGTTLVGLCDDDPDRLRAAQADWEVDRGFSSLEALLEEARPEVVSLCTPDATHSRLLHTILGARSVRAILAEKPLALVVAEAESVARRAAERGVVLAVNYVRRYAPSHQQLRQWLMTGGIGRIEAVQGYYVRGVKHNGTHWLDLARMLCGEIAAVRGSGDVDLWGDDPTIDVSVDFEDGGRGRLTGLARATYTLFEMDIVATAGRVRLVESGDRFDITTVGPSSRFPGFKELMPARGPSGGLADLLMHAVSDLLECVETGRPPACTADDAIRALLLADQALAGARGLEAGIGVIDAAHT
ncbi:MAG: Gfo/Idh/MocA family oxidoreductase [Gemmatimonadota bacterium]